MNHAHMPSDYNQHSNTEDANHDKAQPPDLQRQLRAPYIRPDADVFEPKNEKCMV